MDHNYATVDAAFVAKLVAIVGDARVSLGQSVRDQHGRDESYHPGAPPDVVVYPLSTDEVAAVVRLCAAKRVPIIPFGAGTSLEGHVAAIYGGVCLDFSQMNRVLRVNVDDMDVTIEPGVTRKQLNSHLRDTGLFFPVDPGADATLGGMVATGASGTNAVRYGTMRECVLSLTLVRADGQVVRTAGRARKSSAGYDLTRLMIGSEGTLGVITEICLRLFGVPEAISAAVCPFPTVDEAVQTVITTIQSGVPVARIELLDDAMIEAVNAHAGMSHNVAPTLFFEFHGTPNGVAEQAEAVKAIAADHGGAAFEWAVRQEDRDRLWHARHNAYYAARAMRPNTNGLVGDVCVPISKLAQCIAATRKDLAAANLPSFILGHVGDGNYHTLFFVDPNNPVELENAKRINDMTIRRALEAEGTCTGEHGVGQGKIDFLTDELGTGVEMIAAIKRSLDPDNILNPGKIVRL